MLSALAKYVINRLIHGLFHIVLVISPRLISSLGTMSLMKVISETRCYIKVEASSLLTMSLMKVISETRCHIK